MCESDCIVKGFSLFYFTVQRRGPFWFHLYFRFLQNPPGPWHLYLSLFSLWFRDKQGDREGGRKVFVSEEVISPFPSWSILFSLDPSTSDMESKIGSLVVLSPTLLDDSEWKSYWNQTEYGLSYLKAWTELRWLIIKVTGNKYKKTWEKENRDIK